MIISTSDGQNSRVLLPSRRVVMHEKYSYERESVRSHPGPGCMKSG